MAKALATASAPYRERVILFLAFLTSEDCLRASSRSVEPGALAFSLCRAWFDEVYVPGTRYLDGLKGDRSEEAVRRFQACFTADELAALERFHRFFELRMDMLPGAGRVRASFPEGDLWRHLLKDAAYLLEELAPDPEALRRALARIVEGGAGPDGSADRSAWSALLGPR